MRAAQSVTPPPTGAEVAKALAMFASAVRSACGARVLHLLLFGSRSRGDFKPFSDADVAVVLAGEEWDLFDEKRRLARLAYDAIVETGVHVQGWPVSRAAWEHPDAHTNPTLIRNMKKDAKPLGAFEG